MVLTVTTARGARPCEAGAARLAAERWGAAFVARAGRSLATIAEESGAEAILVLAPHRAALWIDGAEWPWSAGMGELRLKRLLSGERRTRDGFLDATALQPGDHVLDATLGLGMDALVAAGAVGPQGRVLGIERARALAALTAEGLARHPSESARRIEVIDGDAGTLLATLRPKSFDVVFFDPMFRHARAQARGFDLVRRLGDPRPLSPETIQRARTVARRAVVIKDGTPGWDLARLGVAPLPSTRSAEKLYGVLRAIDCERGPDGRGRMK